MSVIDSYRDQIRDYANREYDILYARLRGHLTDTEYRQARMIAYFAHGYIAAARRWAAAWMKKS